MEAEKRKLARSSYRGGSALILAVVLTSLLAIVGTLFILAARVDSVSTSAVSDNRDLNLAVDTLVAKISDQLVLDVPGIFPDANVAEYHDYPYWWLAPGDMVVGDRWLASLEPYDADGLPGAPYSYHWPQISDVTGYISRQGWLTQNIELLRPPIDPRFEPIIDDYWPIEVDADGWPLEQFADADGEGIADSKWFLLEGMTSSKGVPIYAAVRVLDNGSKINVNTVYRNPLTGEDERRGDRLTDIYIDGMVKSGLDDLGRFVGNRGVPADAAAYNAEVSRRIDNPDFNSLTYALYDISDELSLCNRFVLFPQFTIPRLEARDNPATPDSEQCLSTTLRATRCGNALRPYSQWPVSQHAWEAWGNRFNPHDDDLPPTDIDNNYDFRHLLTTYNMDRIITPFGGKMININRFAEPNYVGDLAFTLGRLFGDNLGMGYQTALNIKDYIDTDDDVSWFDMTSDGEPDYYGFEQPCVYISEVVHSALTDVVDPERPTYRSYGVELHKPYPGDATPILNDWRLVIVTQMRDPRDPEEPRETREYWPVVWSGTSRFHVMKWEHPNARLLSDFSDPNESYPADGATGVSPAAVLTWPVVAGADSYNVYLDTSQSDMNEVATGLTTNTYDPDPNLAANTRYYWRVDDVTGATTNTGDVWTFTTGAADTIDLGPQDMDSFGWVPGAPVFDDRSRLELQRRAAGAPQPYDWITVDECNYVPAWVMAVSGAPISYKRDISPHKCIRRLWDISGSRASPATLGNDVSNKFVDADAGTIQAHPENRPLTNIGEIGSVLRRNAYRTDNLPWNQIVPGTAEREARFDLQDPNLQQAFNYLTVFDPSADGVNNDGDLMLNSLADMTDEDDLLRSPEWKIAGRININTAPWYVIAQLPWVANHTPDSFDLARAIVAYRDRRPPFELRDGPPGFRSVGELMNVVTGDPVSSIDFYARDGLDLDAMPDLTAGDGDAAEGNLEERDVIFARMSNLVTVRSDVFTAYILVRIGVDGPQKRVIAILDRSNVYPTIDGPVGKVKIRALHPVGDPR